uniref:protein-serine/threonine phosphatase n=1 Tax=Trieres chinensis TaxID=1514140 RepID=A0A7S1ZK78_TRICV|mmetsp:Transcript_27645/g.56652  ORF Transcript_27645/g.56652 Transcript_27645/m.56652 type:complete len:154 (+) Transcript_27645:334-795(+)
MDVRRLDALGITHVLNVGGRMAAIAPAEAYKVAGIAYKIIEADDVDGYPMLGRHFEDAKRFIDAARKDEHNGKSGACLVHCHAGMNRSGVIVAAYHMLEERANVLNVVGHCRRMRGNVFLSSNNTFQEDLVALARREDLLGPKPSGPFPKYFS